MATRDLFLQNKNVIDVMSIQQYPVICFFATQPSFLVVAVVDGGKHASEWGSHGGTIFLPAGNVVEVEDVISYDDGNTLEDEISGRESAFSAISFMQIEPFADGFNDMIRVDVIVHWYGIDCKEAGISGQYTELLNFIDKLPAVSPIANCSW